MSLRKLLLFTTVLTVIGTAEFAQSKSDQIDLKNVKNFYSRLKDYKIDTKGELVWEYTYGDTSQMKLNSLAVLMEKEGLQKVDIKKAKYEPKKYLLIVSEIKQYSPEALNDRMHYLNQIAKNNNIMDDLAIFSAETPKKETENIKSYKPIGERTK
jgi:hypothetical protein